MEIEGIVYAEKKAAGSAILEACRAMKNPDPVPLGRYRDFAMELYFDPLSREHKITLIGSLRHTASLGTDFYGNIQRLDNTLESLPSRLQNTKDHLSNTRQQLEEAKAAVDKPFPYEEDLTIKSARLAELNALLILHYLNHDLHCDKYFDHNPESNRYLCKTPGYVSSFGNMESIKCGNQH